MAKPLPVPARAGRRRRVAWLSEALGHAVLGELADFSDRELVAYYRRVETLPPDHRLFHVQEPEPLCRRCEGPVEIEVHWHCDCGVDRADLGE